jgi:hypothetical protein
VKIGSIPEIIDIDDVLKTIYPLLALGSLATDIEHVYSAGKNRVSAVGIANRREGE